METRCTQQCEDIVSTTIERWCSFIIERCRVANGMKIMLNADFDGDILNTLGLPMTELAEFFKGFSPCEMLISRVTNEIRYNVSALEQITLAILSDK